MEFGISILAAAVCSYFCTCIAISVAPKLGYIDIPDSTRKKHRNPTPLLGGAAIVVSISITLLIVNMTAQYEGEVFAGYLGLLVSLFLFLAVGLWDDYAAISARKKLAAQFFAAIPYVFMTTSVNSISFFDTALPVGAFAPIFLTFWVILCVNVINLLDGVDGLAASCCAIMLLVLLGASALFAGPISINTLICAVSVASIVGFLPHNWCPARVFLGDAGSLSIGFLIAALTVQVFSQPNGNMPIMACLALVGLPLLDTFMAVVRRRLNGRPIGQGDSEHFHHLLLQRRFSASKTTLFLAAICTVFSLASGLSLFFHSDWIACLGMLGITAFLVVGRIFGHNEMSGAAQAVLVFFRNRNKLDDTSVSHYASRLQLVGLTISVPASGKKNSILYSWHSKQFSSEQSIRRTVVISNVISDATSSEIELTCSAQTRLYGRDWNRLMKAVGKLKGSQLLELYSVPILPFLRDGKSVEDSGFESQTYTDSRIASRKSAA